MFDFIPPKLDFIENEFVYEIHGIRDIIAGLRLGMLKRSVENDVQTHEEKLKDVNRYLYISFLKRQTIAACSAARVYGYTNVSDETALMCIDIHYEDMLRYELGKTDFGPLYSAIVKEIDRTNHRILGYPCTLLNPFDSLNVR